ncbi:hypothetical protein B7494_g5008 [Chlorociboria aeruginascens]|nr:hypothetical protein B7494_g5008 [Chlorociboria aeruginascens]
MASTHNKTNDNQRPRPLRMSKSFSRDDPTNPDLPHRIVRASTMQNGTVAEENMANRRSSSRENVKPRGRSSAFEKSSADEAQGAMDEVTGKLPSDFNKLPIELISLADSFIDSLSAKIHPKPPSVDSLSTLFQDFYAVASSHINTHISTLSSRQHRDSSPAPSASSLSSTASLIRAKAVSISTKDKPRPIPERKESGDQQMLTAEEIAQRKRARKILEQKRIALEEAIEKRVCEGIYDRIWRHRSTQDEAQDEKLRSKTAALSVVGIGLTDLGVDLGQDRSDKEALKERENEVREWLKGAREELIAMNDERFPLGKLLHLKAAHKSIVDTLSHFHPSSSADEIMPMLIYTLITSRPEGINVISNLYFIQRFRNETKIDGEAAYCLTNLEAAISFLETVDLASLREDEAPSGPPKTGSRPHTPRMDKSDPLSISPVPLSAISTNSKPPPSPSDLRPSTHTRRISDLFQPPAALSNAGDAVFSTADQGFKSIGNSLENSYKFLVGKLKERQEDASSPASDIIVPKTLDDARKLVSTPPPDDDGSASGGSSLHSPEVNDRKRSDSGPAKPDDKLLNLIGGLKMSRDRSTDSTRSAGSSHKKVAFVEEGERGPSPLNTNISPQPPSTNPAIVESMRNLGNSLNPINRFAGGMMRGFGRVVASPSPTKSIPDGGVADLATAFPELGPVLPPKEPPSSSHPTAKIAPPIKRFMEIQNPGELRINEVLELLRDYRRLAGALKDLGAV